MLFLASQIARPRWLDDVEAIKVTGSKGKGSTSSLTESILRHLGISTGLFTSPHLVRFAERIQVNGQPVSDDELSAAVRTMLAARESYEAQHPGDTIGAFEVFTGLALDRFSSNDVAGVVAEAGIGGRYDPTRTIPGSVVALTSVELEHTAILGRSKDYIAFDKADLCPSGGTLVVGPIDEEVLRRLRGYCDVRRVEVVAIGDIASVSPPTFGDGLMHFELACDGIDFGRMSTRLLGAHQMWNASVAVAAVRRWLQRKGLFVTDFAFKVAVRQALLTVEWPGRFQSVSTNPTVIIDVGHTPQSARAVAMTLEAAYPQRAALLVTGVSADKDASGIVRELVHAVDAAICTRAYHKGAEAHEIAAQCELVRPGVVWRTTQTIEEAVDCARERALRDDMIVLVAGGLFLAVEAAVYLNGGDPKSLRFF